MLVLIFFLFFHFFSPSSFFQLVTFLTDLEWFAVRLPQPRNLIASETRLLAAPLRELPLGSAEETQMPADILEFCKKNKRRN